MYYLLAVGLAQARGLGEWQQLAARMDRSARDLRMLAGRMPAGSRMRWSDTAPDQIAGDAWQAALDAVRAACVLAQGAGQAGGRHQPDFDRLIERLNTLALHAELFLQPRDPASVRWIDVGVQLRLIESPLDIAQAVEHKLLRTDSAEPNQRAGIFTLPVNLGR